jgi:hypothetical protein
VRLLRTSVVQGAGMESIPAGVPAAAAAAAAAAEVYCAPSGGGRGGALMEVRGLQKRLMDPAASHLPFRVKAAGSLCLGAPGAAEPRLLKALAPPLERPAAPFQPRVTQELSAWLDQYPENPRGDDALPRYNPAANERYAAALRGALRARV